MYAIGETVANTFESIHTREAAKNIDLDSDLEASIHASFSSTLPFILAGNKKETIGGEFEFLIGYLKYYTVWHPWQTKALYGMKNQICDGVKTVMGLIKKLNNTVTKY